MYTIGVLALQGDFSKHLQAIGRLGHQAIEVRNRKDLVKAHSLIIPGGESTTILKLLHDSGFYSELRVFLKNSPAMGTCAGMIILASEVSNLQYEPLKQIDISVDRNAYGRQRESFIDSVSVSLNGNKKSLEAVFIRAPRIVRCGPGVHVLGDHGGKPVIAANESVLVSAFHPELTDDLSIHEYFIDTFM